MENFDPAVYHCPIAGWNLVEASAGTGKTYQVQNLFARLIMEKGWDVDRILVVTFTEAATEELRERLQNVLGDCVGFLDRNAESEVDDLPIAKGEEQVGKIVNAVVRNLASDPSIADWSRSKIRLQCRIRARAAVLSFDNAAISTIHGFCARMLGECAYECGTDFDAELITDTSQLLDEVVRDVWRQEILPLAGEEAELAASLKFDEVVRLVGSRLGKPAAAVLPAVQDEPPSLMTIDGVKGFRALLQASYTQLSEIIQSVSMTHCPQEDAEKNRDKLMVLLDKCVAAFEEAEASGDDASIDTAQKSAKKLTKTAVVTAMTYSTPWEDKRDDEIAGLLTRGKETQAWLKEHKVTVGASGFQSKLVSRDDVVLRFSEMRTACSEKLALVQDYGLENSDRLGVPFGACVSRIEALADLDPAVDDNAAQIHSLLKGAWKELVGFKPKGKWLKHKWPAPPEMVGVCAFFDKAKRVDETWKLWLRRRMVEAAQKRFVAVKRSRNLITYDDLLLRLRNALEADETGDLLKAAIKTRFEIAIIDEFQDTDPVQYGVFEQGFKNNELPVFVVGDPKQAIYSFRSGDLATYIQAREDVPKSQRFSLATNWRSRPGMVAATNELFAEASGDDASGTVNRAFATNEIAFTASTAGVGTVDPCDPDKPLVVELHELEIGGKEGGRRKAAELTAARIARLLYERKVDLGKETVAVLVGTHAEARLVKQALGKQSPPIPAVLQSSGRIFESEQAKDFRFVLQALLAPTDVAVVRAALATSILKGTARELLVDGTASGATELVQKACIDFSEAHKTWHKHGLVVAFGRLAVSQRIRKRQLQLADGERRWTNLLQVSELLDRVAREQKLGMHAVARWLDRQLDGDRNQQDNAYETRLESDDRAVEIMTIFKSKGLERDYVFIPFIWTKTSNVTQYTKFLEYHDADELVLDLDVNGLLHAGTEANPALAAHQDEKLQEHLRLLYVAVTRAKREAHVMHVVAGKESRNPLSYLLTHADPPSAPEVPVVTKWSVEDAVPTPFSAPHYQAIDGVEAAQRFGPIPTAAVGPETDLSGTTSRNPEGAPVCTAKPFPTGNGPRVIDQNWQILSFSKLAGHGGGVDSHDYDGEQPEMLRSEAVIAEERQRLRQQPHSLFAFKAGKITGNCWHAIFEHLDFEAGDDDIREAIEKCSELYRLVGPDDGTDGTREVRLQTLFKMVKETLALHLPLGAGALQAVAWQNRLAEMQFHFPVNARGVSRTSIAAVLADPENGWEGRNKSAIKAVLDKWAEGTKTDKNEDDENEWNDVGLRGFMTGFIDLTFRVKDDEGHTCYYLLDWKSNQIDGTYEGFSPERLVEEMAHSRYFLQYLLYSAALHQYLKTNLSDYVYENNFGGAFYIFLRGVCEPPKDLWDGGEWDGVDRSVYYDCPPERLLNALWAELAGDEA